MFQSQSVPPVIPVTVTETLKDKDKITMARTPAAAKPPKPPAAKAEAFKPPVTFYWPGQAKLGKALMFQNGVTPESAPVVSLGLYFLGFDAASLEAIRVTAKMAKGELDGRPIPPAEKAKAAKKIKELVELALKATDGGDSAFEKFFALWRTTEAGTSRSVDDFGNIKGGGTLAEHIDKVRRGKAGQAGAALSPAAAKWLGVATMPTRPSSVPKNFRRKTEEGSAEEKKAEAEQAAYLADFFGK